MPLNRVGVVVASRRSMKIKRTMRNNKSRVAAIMLAFNCAWSSRRIVGSELQNGTGMIVLKNALALRTRSGI